MGFLDRILGGDDEDQAAGAARERRREEDVARVASGSIPLAAEERLRELGAGNMGFTSGLSVADFALSRLEAIRPICQVMGTSVYKVGWQNYPWTSGWGQDAMLTELTQLTFAWNNARARALARLAAEASAAGCHAVVDVTFDHRRHEFLTDEIDINVNGTAVHLPEGAGEAGTPILTDLSMPDYILLRRGGYAPVGIVASTSVFYIVPSRQTRRMTTGWQRFQPNQELADFTQGVYAARESAIGRATEQARELGAGGLVGMQVSHHMAVREVEQNNQTREDLVVTFHVIGTAIAPHGEHVPLDPQTILRLGANQRA
jgi:uncharacterized protein YbjQ (UPF0145 family)